MKTKQNLGKLVLSKTTVVNLSNSQMELMNGGDIVTTTKYPQLCSVETRCATECKLSICIYCF